MQSKNASHLIMKSYNEMSIHQRKSYKMHIPDSKKCTYVKNAQKEASPSMQTGNASFFVLLFPFFLQLRKFSIMTFSASASVMPSVLSFNSCSSLIRPIAASWMIAASTCFAWISGIDPTWA